MMKKLNSSETQDLFEFNLAIAKAITLLLESEDKENINDIPLEKILTFFNEFVDFSK